MPTRICMLFFCKVQGPPEDQTARAGGRQAVISPQAHDKVSSKDDANQQPHPSKPGNG